MNRNLKARTTVIFTLLFCGMLFVSSSDAQNIPQTPVGYTERVSVASDGAEGNLGSYYSSISANGRYVAFVSDASNLVPGDTNNYCDTDYDGNEDDSCPDVFVHDRISGETTRISIASDGTQGNQASGYNKPSISADGRYVAFESRASNLVAGDSNGYYEDIFVHDRQTGETSLVSVSSAGLQQYGSSYGSAISADGRYVAFQSDFLVEWDHNGFADVFVHDRQTGETSLVSISSSGEQGNIDSGYMISISGNGRYVAFLSRASNLVGEPYIYYETTYVHDRQTGETYLAALTRDGERGNGTSRGATFSADGRFIAFVSSASNLIENDTTPYEDVFVRDQVTGENFVVSVTSGGVQVDAGFYGASISPDGNFVTFSSDAEDLVPGDMNGNMDIFLHNRLTGETTLESVANDGTQGNWHSWNPIVSANGRFIAFDSWASNLVPGDTNNYCVYPPDDEVNCPDVFVRDRLAVGIYTISGRVTDSDGAPVEGATVTAASWYSAVTDDQGYYSIGEVFTGTYTLLPGLDGALFLPLSRTVTLPPNAQNQDFTLQIPIAELAFRPNPDGYQFPNDQSASTADFTINDMRRMFGDEAVCSSNFPACRNTWQAWLWKQYANRSMIAGRSDGMAATSLRFFKGVDAHPSFDETILLAPESDVVINWNSLTFNTSLRKDIAFFSVEQLTQPLSDYKHISSQATPTDVLNEVITALSGGATDPVTLFIRPTFGSSGHTLTPYAVTDHGDDTRWIWVYDSEHPHDDFDPIEAYHYVIVDTVNNTWSYDLGGATWSGDAGSHTFGIVPISKYAQQPECPWCDLQANAIEQAQLWLSGGGHLLISDAHGNRLGFAGMDYVSEIPGTYGGFIDSSSMNSLEPIYTLPVTETYSILLDGQTLAEPISASLAQFGPGYALDVSNLMVGPATADRLTITSDGSKLGYSASQGQEPTISMGVDHPGANYGLSIIGVDVGFSETITLTADTITGELILNGSLSTGGEYGFSIRRVNSLGVAKYLHGGIQILAFDTHILNYADWDGTGSIVLEIDHGSDGTIDETVVLENQLKIFYLSLMFMQE